MQPLLARQGIVARTATDNGQPACYPSFASNQLTSELTAKLQPPDFERASILLVDLNQYTLSQADPNYYLFSLLR